MYTDLWTKLSEISDKNLRQMLTNLYRVNKFPLKIRSSSCEWLEAQDWDIDLSTDSGASKALSLYENLLSELQHIETELSGEEDFDELMELSAAKDDLQSTFNGCPAEFVMTMQKIFLEEHHVLDLLNSSTAMPHDDTAAGLMDPSGNSVPGLEATKRPNADQPQQPSDPKKANRGEELSLAEMKEELEGHLENITKFPQQLDSLSEQMQTFGYEGPKKGVVFISSHDLSQLVIEHFRLKKISVLTRNLKSTTTEGLVQGFDRAEGLPSIKFLVITGLEAASKDMIDVLNRKILDGCNSRPFHVVCTAVDGVSEELYQSLTKVFLKDVEDVE